LPEPEFSAFQELGGQSGYPSTEKALSQGVPLSVLIVSDVAALGATPLSLIRSLTANSVASAPCLSMHQVLLESPRGGLSQGVLSNESAPPVVASGAALSALISGAESFVRSLAVIPINPAHEATVDRLIKDRMARAKSRVLRDD
jgi:hypothetical protein